MLNSWRRIFGFIHYKILLVDMFCTIKDPFQIRFVHCVVTVFHRMEFCPELDIIKIGATLARHVAHNLCFFSSGSSLVLAR